MKSEESIRQDDQLLTRYLLGALPEAEAEPVEQLSVSDDAFALRLVTLENDLVDSYARGELSGETVHLFEAFYLHSPARREKLAFAQSLQKLGHSRTASAKSAVAGQVNAVLPNNASAKSFSLASIFSIPSLRLEWSFAAIAFALLFATGYLAIQNRFLRDQVALRAASRLDEQQLQAQLDDQTVAIAQAQAELTRMSASVHAAATNTAAILLLPQTRGLGQPPQIALPASASALPLQLALESSGFPRYRVALKEPGSDKALWTSEPLSPSSDARSKTISVQLPRQLLKERNYLLQLTGIRANGSPASLSTYMFHVVIR